MPKTIGWDGEELWNFRQGILFRLEIMVKYVGRVNEEMDIPQRYER